MRWLKEAAALVKVVAAQRLVSGDAPDRLLNKDLCSSSYLPTQTLPQVAIIKGREVESAKKCDWVKAAATCCSLKSGYEQAEDLKKSLTDELHLIFKVQVF